MGKKRKLSLVKTEEIKSAIRTGSLEEFKDVVSRDFDINAILSRSLGCLPIHVAAKFGRLDIIEFLLAKGLSLEKIDLLGRSPLHYAVMDGQLAVINRLIDEMKSNFNIVNQHTEKTLLHSACAYANEAVVNLLLNALEKMPEGDRNLNKTDKMGDTPLHIACESMNGAVVGLMLNALQKIPKSDLNLGIVNLLGSTPLHIACSTGEETVVGLLINALEKIHETEWIFSIVDKCGYTPLHIACKSGNQAVVGLLLNALEKLPESYRKLRIVNCHKNSLLHFACDRSNLAVVGLLLNALEKIPETKRNVNTVDKRGNTPLNYLTYWLSENIEEKCDIIKLIINYGAYFNSKDIVRIVDNHSARNALFTDSKLCAQSCLNKLVCEALPPLYDSPLSNRLPLRERLVSRYLWSLENCVKNEIKNNGYYDFEKLIFPLFHLSVVRLSNYCKMLKS